MNTIILDLNDQLMKILATFQIMHSDYAEFEATRDDIKKVFTLLSNKIAEVKQHLNQARIRLDAASQKVMENIDKNHLRDRLEKIFVFRKHHDKFKQIIKKTLSQEASGDKNDLEGVALN